MRKLLSALLTVQHRQPPPLRSIVGVGFTAFSADPFHRPAHHLHSFSTSTTTSSTFVTSSPSLKSIFLTTSVTTSALSAAGLSDFSSTTRSTTNTLSSAAMGLPTVPTTCITEFGSGLRESSKDNFASIMAEFAGSEQKHQTITAFVGALFNHGNLAMQYLLTGLMVQADKEIEAVDAIVAEQLAAVDAACGVGKGGVRQERVSYGLETALKPKALRHFFQTGNLIRKADLPEYIQDSEYLGAVMGLSQVLSNKYAIGQATELDASSVQIARKLIDELNGSLLQFDFRNGSLRQKYDGVKYDLKRVDDILYELSLVDAIHSSAKEGQEPPLKKRACAAAGGGGGADSMEIEAGQADKADGSGSGGGSGGGEDSGGEADSGAAVVDAAEMDAIRVRMAEYDDMRETVIKKARDMQKAAKQAVYSLHRGGAAKAKEQLHLCVKTYQELLPTITKEPSLRMGSVSNALEEWAEAKLYETWLIHKRLANKDELEICTTEEYIGGLFDMTGELNRFAVAQATQRQADVVKQCLETILIISEFLSLASLPPKLNKKDKELKNSVRKIQNMTYELALKKAGKGAVAGVGGSAQDEDVMPANDET